MIKVYGSKMCPDCQACTYNFDEHHIEYEFIDVCESLPALRQFLIYRDTNPVFDRLKAINDIGLPACVKEDGTIFTDWESYVRELGLDVKKMDFGNACSLDHKGC